MILSVYEISPAEWMTTQWLYLTWYPMYLCNQTHLTNDITTYVLMKPHPLHAWHHRHFIWHHIHSCWQHTIVSLSWQKLCLWHHMYNIWCHPYCVYDEPSSISDLKHVKTDISSTPYVITPRITVIASTVAELLLTVYWLEHVCKMCDIKPLYVWHYMNSMWYHSHYYWHQKTVFMTSHPQYSWIQTHCIRHDIQYTCDITATVTMTRHLQYFWHDTQCIWDLTRWMNDNATTVSDMIPNVSV